MSSRMERYYTSDEQNSLKRSDKNAKIYKDLQEINNYSNIEGIATIDNPNEIDITKIKKMIESRENYHREKDLRKALTREHKLIEEKEHQSSLKEIKSYDLKELFDQAKKEDRNPENKHKKLKSIQYNVNEKISSQKTMQKQEKDQNFETDSDSDDVGLLDELKSDTMVGQANSIKMVLDEAKETTLSNKESSEENSFFTTSTLGFTKSDFEDLEGIDKNKKTKKTKFLIFPIVFIVIVVIAIAIYQYFVG